MMRAVDPMMIDDDIFSENNLVAEQHDLYNTLGNPPEPPKALSERSGITAYVPNMIEEEDDDGDDNIKRNNEFKATIPSSDPLLATQDFSLP